jgi:hypothetical protein
MGFVAQRGTGQGDVSSPFIWNAVYDMLLCALDTARSGPFYTLAHTGELQPVEHIAYVDDLITIRSTLTGLQEAADVVSGFCCLFGLTLATAKF